MKTSECLVCHGTGEVVEEGGELLPVDSTMSRKATAWDKLRLVIKCYPAMSRGWLLEKMDELEGGAG